MYFRYSGYKEEKIDEFHDAGSNFLSIFPQKNTTTINIGAEINAAICTRACLPETTSEDEDSKKRYNLRMQDTVKDLIGTFGNKKVNKNGDKIHSLMREHGLRAAATFFDNNKKHSTWVCPLNAVTRKIIAHQIDHFLFQDNH